MVINKSELFVKKRVLKFDKNVKKLLHIKKKIY